MSNLDLLLNAPSGIQHSQFVVATVTQVSPLLIRLDGDTAALPFTPATLNPLTYVMGQRVVCCVINGQLVVMGEVSDVMHTHPQYTVENVSQLVGAEVSVDAPNATVYGDWTLYNGNVGTALRYHKAIGPETVFLYSKFTDANNKAWAFLRTNEYLPDEYDLKLAFNPGMPSPSDIMCGEVGVFNSLPTTYTATWNDAKLSCTAYSDTKLWVTYWDASGTRYFWNGTAWTTSAGGTGYTWMAHIQYVFHVVKTATTYTLTVETPAGVVLLAPTPIAISGVRAGDDCGVMGRYNVTYDSHYHFYEGAINDVWMQTGLTTATYQFGWRSYNADGVANARLWYAKSGAVGTCSGCFSGGNVSYPVTILPRGYRPVENQILPYGPISGGSGYCSLNAAGVLKAPNATYTLTSGAWPIGNKV